MRDRIQLSITRAYINLFLAIKEQAEKDCRLQDFELYWLGPRSPVNWSAIKMAFGIGRG